MTKETVDKQMTYEETLGALELCVSQIESGDLPLEKGLEQVEAGRRHLAACESILAAAKGRIEVRAVSSETG